MDIPVYFALVPNAANVMSDKLPALAETEAQEKQFENIRKELGGKINWVDVLQNIPISNVLKSGMRISTITQTITGQHSGQATHMKSSPRPWGLILPMVQSGKNIR